MLIVFSLEKKSNIIYRMSDYKNSINSYFSNFGNLNNFDKNAQSSSDQASLQLKSLNVDYFTYILSFFIIILFFVIFSAMNISFLKVTGNWKESTDTSNSFYKVVELIFVALILISSAVVVMNYILGLNIGAKLSGVYTDDPKIDIVVEKDIIESPKIINRPNKEVFNLPENIYTYSDAKNICKAYDAELASIKNIQDAHKKGGEWCSYGWSKNQMALFPTQYKTWEKLQKTKDHKNDCGRPGVNGGYMSNPNAKFGVNCYGYKPGINAMNKNYMDNLQLYPTAPKDVELENKIQYWKNNLDNILVAPFNSKKWKK